MSRARGARKVPRPEDAVIQGEIDFSPTAASLGSPETPKELCANLDLKLVRTEAFNEKYYKFQAPVITRLTKYVRDALRGIEKNNLLLLGDTGSGKSLVAMIAASVAMQEGGRVLYANQMAKVTDQFVEYADRVLLINDNDRVAINGALVPEVKERKQIFAGPAKLIISSTDYLEGDLESDKYKLSDLKLKLAIIDEGDLLIGNAKAAKLVDRLREAGVPTIILSATPYTTIEDAAAFTKRYGTETRILLNSPNQRIKPHFIEVPNQKSLAMEEVMRSLRQTELALTNAIAARIHEPHSGINADAYFPKKKALDSTPATSEPNTERRNHGAMVFIDSGKLRELMENEIRPALDKQEAKIDTLECTIPRPANFFKKRAALSEVKQGLGEAISNASALMVVKRSMQLLRSSGWESFGQSIFTDVINMMAYYTRGTGSKPPEWRKRLYKPSALGPNTPNLLDAYSALAKHFNLPQVPKLLDLLKTARQSEGEFIERLQLRLREAVLRNEGKYSALRELSLSYKKIRHLGSSTVFAEQGDYSDFTERLASTIKEDTELGFPEVASVNGKTGSKQSAETLEKLRNGELDMLVTNQALYRSLDAKIGLIILWSPIRDPATFRQVIGRAGRHGDALVYVLCTPAQFQQRYELLKKIETMDRALFDCLTEHL